MNLKIELLKALFFTTLGAFLYSNYAPKPESPNLPALEQKQVQECKATIKKRTNPDGSVDEIAEFLATNSQSQKAKPLDNEKPKVKLNGLGLFENEIVLKRKVLQDVKLFGYNFDTDIMLKADRDEAKAGVMIEW
jgi:hypothetical protein